jgi:FkbM family methyltransferase
MNRGLGIEEEPRAAPVPAAAKAPSPARFSFVRVCPSPSQAHWTVVDPAETIVDSADGYLRFLRFKLGVDELVNKQYARNLAYFLSWAAELGLDVQAAAGALQPFSVFLRSVPERGSDDFLVHRPERIGQVLATVHGFYMHLVGCEELALETLGRLHELIDLRDLGTASYAQNGEDLQIAYYVGRERITYIDIGCLWPRRHSNSYFFYERGGAGLCIDANPTVAEEHHRERPRDIFLNCGIAAADGAMTYYMHKNPVFNTFSAAHAAELAERAVVMASAPRREGRTLTGTMEIPIMTLDRALRSTEFLARYGERLDFLSIDVEGLELEVLAGFSFQAPRPRLVVVEEVRRGSQVRLAPEELPIAQLLKTHHYWLAGRSGVNLYFLDETAGRRGSPSP